MESYLENALAFARSNPLLAGAIAVALLYLVVRKLKLLLFALLLAAVCVGALYFIFDITGKGGVSKVKMINQTGGQDVQ